MENRPANTGLTPKCFKTSHELIKFTISFIALVVITRQICTYFTSNPPQRTWLRYFYSVLVVFILLCLRIELHIFDRTFFSLKRFCFCGVMCVGFIFRCIVFLFRISEEA